MLFGRKKCAQNWGKAALEPFTAAVTQTETDGQSKREKRREKEKRAISLRDTAKYPILL